MSDITQNLLSTYYGFGKEIDATKKFSVHDCANILSDETNNSIVDESVENQVTSTKESSKEEDTIEHYEDGFSTLDEKSTIEDEEVFEDEDLLNEYVDVLESLREQKDFADYKTDAIFLEVNTEKVNNNENDNMETSKGTRSPPENLNEDQKHDVHSNSCSEISLKKNPSCNGIFLDLSGSGICTFPEDMFVQFPNLKMLYLEGNNLKKLPDALFTTLKLLQWLDVRSNHLNYLPSTIKGHPNLETILIQKNKMEKLPLELGTLPKLKRLQIAHNPLIYPPTEILSLGSIEILRYLRDGWNKIHPAESIESLKVSEEITPKPSMILCYQPKTNSKNKFKITKKESTAVTKAPDKKSVRRKTWNYKPSNRCNSSESNEFLEHRLLWLEKAKEFLEERSSALQKLLDCSTLRNWRYDRSSFNKSMIKAASRSEENIPFAVDPNSIAVSMKKNQKKKPSINGSVNRNKVFEEPITDINKNIDDVFESLNKLKANKSVESLSPKTEKKILELEIWKIINLQNSIKHLQKHNDMITDPYAAREITSKSFVFPPSIII